MVNEIHSTVKLEKIELRQNVKSVVWDIWSIWIGSDKNNICCNQGWARSSFYMNSVFLFRVENIALPSALGGAVPPWPPAIVAEYLYFKCFFFFPCVIPTTRFLWFGIGFKGRSNIILHLGRGGRVLACMKSVRKRGGGGGDTDL